MGTGCDPKHLAGVRQAAGWESVADCCWTFALEPDVPVADVGDSEEAVSP